MVLRICESCNFETFKKKCFHVVSRLLSHFSEHLIEKKVDIYSFSCVQWIILSTLNYHEYLIAITYIALIGQNSEMNNNNDRLTAFDPGQPG